MARSCFANPCVGHLLSSHSRVEGNVFGGTMLGGLLLNAETTMLSEPRLAKNMTSS